VHEANDESENDEPDPDASDAAVDSAIGARVRDRPDRQHDPEPQPPSDDAPGRPASFWRRLGAYLSDLVLLGLVNSLVTTATLGPIPETADPFNPNLAELWPYYAVNATVAWLYFAGLESSKLQATLGKRLLSLTVTDDRGERVSFLRATGRHFGKILSTLPLGLGFLMIFTTEDNQALHDRLASCLIRHDTDPEPDTAHGPASPTEDPTSWEGDE
jgi:uncharacterized RDD family membrane protein YckC